MAGKNNNTYLGWFCVLIGGSILATAAGLIGIPDDSVHAPKTVLGLCSIVFIAGGFMMLAGPRSRFNALGAFAIGLCFGLIGTWVTFFSPPESISGGLPLLSQSANAGIGRWVFGIGSLISYGIVAIALRQSLRRPTVKKPPQ